MIKKGLVNNDGEEEYTSIVLPLKKRDLGDFISSLLGQQQSIERELDEKFDIDHSWLVNLHDLLHQRICQQASANLIEFVAVVYFDGGFKRTITTVESFISYTETKNELPVGVRMIWSYLVLFPGRQYPEKQQISFFAHIHADDDNNKLDSTRVDMWLAKLVLGSGTERSSIGYNVEHTERTWGDDLDVIISNQIDGVLRGVGLRDSIYNIFRWVLSAIVFIFCFIYPLMSITSGTSDKIFELAAQYHMFGDSSTIESLNAKLDHLVLMVEVIGAKNQNAFIAALPLLAPVLLLLVLRVTRKSLSSFIIISRASVEHKTAQLASEKRSNLAIAISYLLAVAAGITGNYGYSWLMGG